MSINTPQGFEGPEEFTGVMDITDDERAVIENTSFEDLLDQLTSVDNVATAVELGDIPSTELEPAMESLLNAAEALRDSGAISRQDIAALQAMSASMEGFEHTFDRLPLKSYTELPSKVNFTASMENIFGDALRKLVELIKKAIAFLKKAARNTFNFITFQKKQTVRVTSAIDKAKGSFHFKAEFNSKGFKDTPAPAPAQTPSGDDVISEWMEWLLGPDGNNYAFMGKMESLMDNVMLGSPNGSVCSKTTALLELFQGVLSEGERLPGRWGNDGGYVTSVTGEYTSGPVAVAKVSINLAKDVNRSIAKMHAKKKRIDGDVMAWLNGALNRINNRDVEAMLDRLAKGRANCAKATDRENATVDQAQRVGNTARLNQSLEAVSVLKEFDAYAMELSTVLGSVEAALVQVLQMVSKLKTQ
ncbi:hypothetical protein D3C76_112520 [compost metagenome]